MLNDKVRTDLTAAMKAGDKFVVETLRLLVSEINYKQIDLGREMTDADVAGVIEKEVKKRREAVAAFTAGSRPEQAKAEEKEIQLLAAYLPQQMTREEIVQELKTMNLPKDFGQAMKIVAGVFKGKADGRMVADLVKELIS